MKRFITQAACVALAAALLALTAPPAAALINPRFTPIDLVRQSELILVLRLGPAEAKGEIPVQVVEGVKGKLPQEAPRLDLGSTAKAQADALRGLISSDKGDVALLFAGKRREDAPETGGETDAAAKGAGGLLHVQGRWFRLAGRTPGHWQVEAMDDDMQGCWAGGTDMLLRAVRYIQSDPNPEVPLKAGVKWAEPSKIAKVDGKVHGAMAVDLAGDGRLCLHILCDAGDRLFRWDREAKAFVDLAGKLRLGAKSRLATWGDFDADGRLDSASWDGKSLALWLQTDRGFEARDIKAELPGGCLGLAAIDVGAKGRAGILVSTPSVPILLRPEAALAFKAAPIAEPAAGKFPGGGLGQARPCLVADFDGDGVADIVQPFAKGALFYKGKGPGAFDAPQPCGDLGTGPGIAGAFVGDFDADGLLDIFVAAEEGCLLWQNRGGGKFEEALQLAGEAAYISKPGGIGGMAGDVNQDGRQDVLILYPNRAPHLFFNRGFRSFGHAHELDVEENQCLPAASEGQQAGLLADLDGDGAQEMALVLAGGEVWAFFRAPADAPALSVRAALAVGGPLAGPVTVTGWSGKRCLGAWNLVAGTAEGFFGQRGPGTIKVQWRLPARQVQEKQVLVRDKPVRWLLEP